MSEKAETFTFSDGQPTNVVKLPWRKFPGIVIQGDTLNTYVSRLTTLLEDVRKLDNVDLEDSVSDLVEGFEEYLSIYEEVLETENIELPYIKK